MEDKDNIQLEKRWNAIGQCYSSYVSVNYQAAGMLMFNYIDCTEASSILEIGCGDGTSSLDYILSKPPACRLHLADLSSLMCSITRRRVLGMKCLINQGCMAGMKHRVIAEYSGMGDDFDGRQFSVPELNVNIIRADAEDFGQATIPDSSIDRIIAGQTLHLVNDPKRMLAECLRILTPGGRAIFSVWGSKDNSYDFTLIDEVKRELDIEPSTARSSWHLNDRDKLIKMLQDSGYENVTCWETLNVYSIGTKEVRLAKIRFQLSGSMPKDEPVLLEKAAQMIYAKQNDVIKNNNFPIALSQLYVCGWRPCA